VLIIDNIGMLSVIYRYCKIAYIGGGFGKGIHNILEAAVYGIPVIFGPNHQKFREAAELISLGGGFSVNNGTDLKISLDGLIRLDETYRNAAGRAADYIKSNTGATVRIMEYLRSKWNI
jgi:3-deoxy-D-manno-octulosonic-acid transferase